MVIDDDILKKIERCCSQKDLDRFRDAQRSIKHPRFKYAVYDMETGEVTYKWKKWNQWFSNKRIVYIKVKKQ